MQISRRCRITTAFVLTWDDIQKIHKELSVDLPKISLNATSADGLTRSFEDLDELCSFRNAKKTEITELEFIARDSAFGQRCTMSFSSRRQSNVSFAVDATETTATRLNEFFEDLIESMRPWYSIVARINWENLLLGLIFMVTAILLTAALIMGKIKEVAQNSFSGDLKIGGIISGLIPWVIAIALNKTRDKFFPMGTFSIGDGTRRHNQLETIRTTVIVSFFISIAASCVMLFV